MCELEDLTADEAFSYQMVESTSQAAKSLFMWVKAVRNYFYVYKTTQTFRDKLIMADL